MNLNEKELKLLEQVCKQYIATKGLVETAEKTDRKSGANVQINKEFRDALSHLLRAFGDILLTNGEKKKEKDDYYSVNFDKAIGHLFRAGFDAMEGVIISLRENINELKDFPPSIRNQVMSDYVSRIEKLENFHYKLEKYKANKDIGNDSSTIFMKSIEEMRENQIMMAGLDESVSEMYNLQEEYNKNKKLTWIQGVILSVFSLVLGIVATYLLT